MKGAARMYDGSCWLSRAKPAPLHLCCPANPLYTRECLRRLKRTQVLVPNHGSDRSSADDSRDRSHDGASGLWGTNSSNHTVSAAVLPVSQQSLNMAFHVLDRDEDGLISRTEAYRMVAFYLTLQQYKAPEPAARPLTWDQHLIASIATASKLSGGRIAATWTAMEAYVAAKMAGGLQKHPPRCSDLVWAGLGMATAFLALGSLAAAAKALPVVGHWHQHGLPLLLGSFGTIAILLFGRPEADAVRLWPIVAGQLGATAIAISMIQMFGASLITRACAMAATVMYMMWTDTIHPPGGALVLMSMDNAAIQQFQWAYMLWPSLLLCLGVMLPISAATNWLRRNRQFDWPGSTNTPATLQQKQKNYREQQQKKADMKQRHAAMMLTDRIVTPITQHPGVSPLSGDLKGTVFRLSGLARAIAHYQQKQQLEQQWQGQRQQEKQQKQQRLADGTMEPAVSADGGAVAQPIEAKQKMSPKEMDRKLEDELFRKQLWGTATPNFTHFERKLQKLHEERLKQKKQQPKQNPAGAATNDVSQVLSSSSSTLSSGEDTLWQQYVYSQQQKLYSQHEQQQQQQSAIDKPAWMFRWRSDIATVPGVGDFGYVGALDSFAPDDAEPRRL